MKKRLEELLLDAVAILKSDGDLPTELKPECLIERARDAQHGDFATNLAMTLAKPARSNPRALAEKIIAALAADPVVTKVEIAGPGFINFFIDPQAQFGVIRDIHEAGHEFGKSRSSGAGQRVQVEFVSANPTGPLHVGHGRGAAYGAVVANLLAAIGCEVHREYYVNDAGRQMDILAASVWLRYLEECGESLVFPSNGYRGEYVRAIAFDLHKAQGERLRRPAAEVFAGIPADEPQGGDKELHIDALVARAKELLGSTDYREVFDAGLNDILADIRQDLEEFGVHYEEWFSERGLTDSGAVQRSLDTLQTAGYLY